MKSFLLLSLFSSLSFFAFSQSSPKEKAMEDNAVAAARSWLKLVDNNQYDKSWDQAAALFKKAVTKEGWNKALQTSRAPLGKLLSRSLKSKKYATQLPGAPDGQYVVIQFETSFENKKSA
jgi:hypothetical protein